MRVRILVEFDVQPLEDDELTENDAKAAASHAAWNYLALEKTAGYDGVESVNVHVDGYGKCRVSLGEDHE